MRLSERFQIRSIQAKIILWAALCVVGVSVAIIVYATLSLYDTARRSARDQVIAGASPQISAITAQFDKTLDMAHTLAHILTGLQSETDHWSPEQVGTVIKSALGSSDGPLVGAYVVWEPPTLDEQEDDQAGDVEDDVEGGQFVNVDGRLVAYVIKDRDGQIHLAPVGAEQAEKLIGYYQESAGAMQANVFEPRPQAIRGSEIPVISFVAPLVDDAQFLGIVGLDLDMDFFQRRVDEATVYEDFGQMAVFSPAGVLAAAKGRPEWVGMRVQDVYEDFDARAALEQDQEYVETAGDFLQVVLPIAFDSAVKPWRVGFWVPWDQATARENQLKWQFVGIGVFFTLLALGALWYVSGLVVKPITQITEVARSVAEGNLSVSVQVQQKDETGVLADVFNQMVFQLRDMLRSEQEQREYLEISVREYVAYMDEVAQGNLSARLDVVGYGSGEDPLIVLGRSLNEMTASLQQMIRRIQEAANDLSASSSEILAATTQQASGASEQSAAISQTTTTVSELKTIAEQSVSRAQEVAGASRRTVEVSQQGIETVDETIASMREIKARVESIAENILALSEQTQQIGEIIATVNDIADQSNMLALNASVEAARAGEYGKGFAVVAQEVRNLAEQSRQATAQVKTILSDIQRATNATVMATEEGTKGADEGVALAAQAGETIEQLAGVIEESAQAAMQLVAGGRQQASGVEQVSLAMQNINQATAQSLASTREAERAAQDLNGLAHRLSEIVARYQL
jgi:methyl-accepting chemotaxis protein